MFAVRSGGATTVTGSGAGEDMFVLAGTATTLSGVSAGDDLTVSSTGTMSVDNAATTGTGADGRSLVYAACCSNPIPVLQIVTSAPDLSNIPLSSPARSEEHTSELQSLMRISYAVFCLKKKNQQQRRNNT